MNELRNPTGPETWSDGYRAAQKETFDWCIAKAKELGEKGSSDIAKTALNYLADQLQKEIDRRQPPKVKEEKSDD